MAMLALKKEAVAVVKMIRLLWASVAISTVIAITSVIYASNQKRKLDKFRENVTVFSERTPIAVSKQYKDTTIEAEVFGSEHDGVEVELIDDDECCPEEELINDDLLDMVEFIESEINPTPIPEKQFLRLSGDAWLRMQLTNEYGDNPDVDIYIDLLRRQREEMDLTFQDFLLYAELEYKYNPSEDAKKLLDILGNIASDDSKEIVDFSVEYVSD